MLLDSLFNLVATGEGAGTTASTIDWSNIITASSFDGMLDGISTVLPIVVPVALVVASVPVVWKIVKKMMRG